MVTFIHSEKKWFWLLWPELKAKKKDLGSILCINAFFTNETQNNRSTAVKNAHVILLFKMLSAILKNMFKLKMADNVFK